MPRRCLADRLLDMVDADPRLLLAGPAAAMVFVRLMRLSARLGSAGEIVFGSAIRNLAEVSLAVSIPETDLETHVGTLVDRGVLVREGEALVCPALREMGRKAAAARANGGLGGRPRKGETVEAARARRQGSMLLPVAGGKPTETEARTLSRAGLALASSEEKAEAKPREETDAAITLGRRVLEVAGIDEARFMGSYHEVRAWLAEGLDAETILATVRTVASRPNYTAPKSLRYFTPAMSQARPVVAADAPAPAYMATEEWREYRAACERFRANPYGPAPVMPEAIRAAMAARAA